MPDSIHARVLAEVERRGPIPFAELVELALYDPVDGFYAGHDRGAGRRGDFVTSPEIGPLFGAVLARAVDGWWAELGEPDPFVVVDAGAGPGALARSFLAAGPACAPALRYVLVERSAEQRRRHAEHLRLEAAALAFAPAERDAEAPPTLRRQGPIAVSLASLPRVAGPMVLIANELLDNLPFGLAERGSAGWDEVRVGAGESPGSLAEVLVPGSDELAAQLDRLVPDAPEGARVPVQHAARRWLGDALGLIVDGGRVVVLDYASHTQAMAGRPQESWLRTYHEHRRGAPPLDALGRQDITCEVAVDQLALVRRPEHDRTQIEFLRAHGIDDLVDEGRRTWAERAHVGDLPALQGRSRVHEAEALLDPVGLGSFRVLEWARPGEVGRDDR